MKKITLVRRTEVNELDEIITEKIEVFNKIQRTANEIYHELSVLCKVYPDFCFDLDEV